MWDLEATIRDEKPVILHRLELHKAMVQALEFSPDGSLLASLGGQDDNSLVIWDVAVGSPIAGSPAASHAALTLAFYNNSNDRLVTAGQYHVRIWEVSVARRRLTAEDVKLGSIKRVFTAVALDDTDTVAYCGTSSGDLLGACQL